MIDNKFWINKIKIRENTNDEWDLTLKNGNISDKNHIPSKTKYRYIGEILVVHCEKCNFQYGLYLNSNKEIIPYSENATLTCDEITIKGILE